MFLRIDNDGGSAHGALAASALQQSGAAPSSAPLRLSCRMFVLDRYDALYRLPIQTFERMLQAPKKHLLPRFAASRVRLSDVAVELDGKRPVRVVWSTFDLLVFDDQGRLNVDAYERHQRACAELGLMPPLAGTTNGGTVVDAAQRFVVQGGCWVPSPLQLRRIGAAALGLVSCQRI
jgi:hypothetical protein